MHEVVECTLLYLNIDIFEILSIFTSKMFSAIRGVDTLIMMPHQIVELSIKILFSFINTVPGLILPELLQAGTAKEIRQTSQDMKAVLKSMPSFKEY